MVMQLDDQKVKMMDCLSAVCLVEKRAMMRAEQLVEQIAHMKVMLSYCC